MMITCKEVIEGVGGQLLSGNDSTIFQSVSVDSRKIENNSLYVPIIGEKFDGHNFIENALQAGAIGALTEKADELHLLGNKVIIKVNDTSKALKDLASLYRKKSRMPYVAITGSVGKTGTKEMVAAVLSSKYNLLKSKGNFNNQIGVPLTMFDLSPHHQVGVIEMGTSMPGEIRELTSIVRPNLAIITNINLSHAETLGGKANILKAKMEIVDGLDESGVLLLNGDDDMLFTVRDLTKFRNITYGMTDRVDFKAYNITVEGERGVYFSVKINCSQYRVHIPALGIHNVYSALAAILVGLELDVPIKDIIMGISKYAPYKMRLNVIKNNGMTIISDCYNAGPDSMKAALEVLNGFNKEIGRKIAVLGDMLELGAFSAVAHNEVGIFAVSAQVDFIITVGTHSIGIADGALEKGFPASNVVHFSNNKEAIKYLKDFLKDKDLILVKGSRGMRMEEIVEFLAASE